MKKVLCLILSVLLVVLSFPVSALAWEENNEFTVHFSTTWYGDEGQVNFVKVNDEIVEDSDTKEFVEGSPIAFTLIRPSDWQTPVVKIVDSNGTIWRSDYGEGNIIEIVNDEFTFTPTSNAYFDVFVYWDEFEAFDCGEGNYCVRVYKNDNGTSELSKTSDNFVTNDWGAKYAFPVGTDVTVTFIPNDGYEVSRIYVDGKEYCNDPSREYEKSLSELKYGSEDRSYEYTISGVAEGEEYYANAEFELSSKGAYQVFYSGWYDEDFNPITYVKVGEKFFEDGDVSSFEKNAPVTFTIVHPDDEDIKVVVKIEDNKGNVWRSDYAAGDSDKIDISGNKFTFTPKSDNSFSVYVYWNEYEAFDCGEGNYCVRVYKNDNGTIVVPEIYTDFITDGWRTKYAFPVGTDVTLTFTPDDGYEVDYIQAGGKVYCNDPSEEREKQLSELYNSEKQCYEYTISGVAEGEEYYANAEFELSSKGAYELIYTTYVNEDDEPITYVKVGNEIIESYGAGVFENKGTPDEPEYDPITFTLVRPESWKEDETPVAEIVVSGKTIWRSCIVDEEFTFTPTSDDSFTVYVYWSEYEAFECGEGNYCVEIGIVRNGTIEFSETCVDSITDGWRTKYAFPVETDVTLTFTPDDGYEVSRIYLDGEEYCNDLSEEWEKQLSELYNSEKQCYEYTISGAAEGEEYYANAEFELSSKGAYQVFYTHYYDAYVMAGGKILKNGAASSFETNEPIAFTVVPPDIEDLKVVVKIEDNEGNVWRSDYAAGNPDKIDISGNEFTFTPKSDNNFSVYVYWNEYEAFDCGKGNYCIEIGGVENGKIELSETTDNYITNGWSTKYAFPVETNVTLTFIPDDGYEVSHIYKGYEVEVSLIYVEEDYCNDEWGKQLSELYNSEKQCYEYTISGAVEGEEYYAYAEFELSSKGAYQVFYTGHYDAYDNLLCYVMAGGKTLEDGAASSFETNEPIAFTVVPPDIEDLKVVVKIEDNEGNVWRSDYAAGDPDKIDISGNKFTFTPKSDNSFSVYVYWNEYEAFDCGEGNYYVESDLQGKIEFSKAPVKSVSDRWGNTKYAFPVDEDLTVYIIPDENYEVSFISFDGWPVYYKDPNEKWGEKPLSELNYNREKGGYEYTIEANTVSQGSMYFINTGYEMASEHAYRIDYDEQYGEDWEIPIAYVKVGDNIVESYSACSFVTNNKLEFTMVPPENRSTDTPIVEIEVYDGDEDTPNSIWRSDFDAGNKIEISDNKFSFTPETDKSFVVRVWWSDFDILECGAGNYFIHTFSDGNGSYKFSKTPLRTVSHGNETKYEFPVDEEVKVAFVPNGGYELDNVTLYEWLVYNNDPGTDSENLSDLYNANTKCYEYVFEIDLRNEGEDLYLEAQYKKTKGLFGDINGDETVNNRDVVQLFKYVSKFDVKVNKNLVDVNEDGNVDNRDVIELFRYVSQI